MAVCKPSLGLLFIGVDQPGTAVGVARHRTFDAFALELEVADPLAIDPLVGRAVRPSAEIEFAVVPQDIDQPAVNVSAVAIDEGAGPFAVALDADDMAVVKPVKAHPERGERVASLVVEFAVLITVDACDDAGLIAVGVSDRAGGLIGRGGGV